MAYLDEYAARALEHVRYLSVIIGGRGSCSPHERRAAEYVAGKMRDIGLQDVRLETYQGVPNTYRPYALVFGLAAVSTLLAWLVESPWTAALAALANALGIWGMLAETDFATNWMRLLLPKAEGQNAVGVIAARQEVRQRLVLSAHLDSHRTPIFYSSKRWHTLFQILVTAAFVSLILGTAAYGVLAVTGWQGGLWIGGLVALVQIVFFNLCLHADHTPFSPGANDNASGVGITLALAESLLKEPAAHTEVWLAFTGSEEAGAHGIVSFLNDHAAELGDDAVYLVLDQVGAGVVTYLTADGLIIKRKTHARALELARGAADSLPNLVTQELAGIAYTDAAVATKRGLAALTVAALPQQGSEVSTHWHQMTDTLDRIEPQVLTDAHSFTLQVLRDLDAQA
jgi:hypothetical protein